MRWLENVEKDLTETKVKEWLQKAVNREEWASVTDDSKALPRAVEPKSKYRVETGTL